MSDTRDDTTEAPASRDTGQPDGGVAVRRPNLAVPRALWRMVRPDQVGLILLLYGVGCVAGLATTRATAAGTRPQIAGGALALAVTTATVHYANEYADYETDAIAAGSEFSGGSGALHDYGLPRSVARQATVSTAVATVPAGVLAWLSGVPPRALAVLGVVLLLGWQYSLPPLALAWRGLEVPTNALVGALLLPVYAVSVVTPPTAGHVAVFLPFTLVTGLSLLTTHWPDREADAAVGKRTLPTRLAPRRLRRVFLVVAAGYVACVAVVVATVAPPTPVSVAYLVPLPAIAWGARTFTRRESPVPGVTAMVSLAVALGVAWALEWGVV
ncbi:MAG: 1,4-dihydroxy-2-naphthoate octaprenyltransferase [halophilic archaeon J07HB67]|jgi:1,4-dihydroxy-2-naphthoate octaprenyltransferase|nr:MAG: 1,4-dihydroxy-2-naphthoate octaprenyltransferase [halophilic archaeon J07HB67]